jgi:hypothetical protein
MIKLDCPICENPLELPARAKEKERLTCPNCFAQLALYKHDGKYVLGCAMCAEPLFDPGNCGDCERRREKRRILEDGRL